MKTRREFLSIAAGYTAGSLFLSNTVRLLGAEEKDVKKSWKIGICDWDIRARGDLRAFAAAKELGFEGIQVSFETGNRDTLMNKANRPKFLETAKETGIAIASFCMGELNSKPLATTPEAEGWVEDCINAMDEMSVPLVLLPFFSNGDIKRNRDHQPMVIEKLKRLAPIAEKKKKVLAFESPLSAEDLLKIFDAVGSDALKVYYDTLNTKNQGYDIFKEMELLGSKKLLGEVHFKESRARLGDGDIDFTKVCETLEKVGYEGWIVVESSTSGDWKESQTANAQFVKKLIGR